MSKLSLEEFIMKDVSCSLLTPPSSGPCSEPHRCCWLLLVAQVIEALPEVADEVRGLVKEIKAGNASVTGVRIRTA